MNCCNSYGECTQGKDCPARSLPEDESNEPWDSLEIALISAIILFMGIAIGGGLVLLYLTH